MPLSTNIQAGDPDHPGLHNEERAAINAQKFGHVLNPGDSLNAAIAAGHKLILMNPGLYEYNHTVEFGLEAKGTRVVGAGQHTRVRCTASSTLDAFFELGCEEPVDGIQLDGLSIEANNNAHTGVLANPYSTGNGQWPSGSPHGTGSLGYYQGEPDGVFRINNLWVYDAVTYGIWTYYGSTQYGDTTGARASRWSNVRVRRAGNTGFYHQTADSWLTDVEATTGTSGTNIAGFHINAANGFYNGLKPWYCRGYGFRVRGTRNTFVNCHSQDTREHGWFIEWDKNTFIGCIADSAAYEPVGGTLNGADGWYISGSGETTIQGCMGFDRGQGAPLQQRYGINAPAAMFEPDADGFTRIDGFVGYDNATALVNKR